ncbi:hypothetical protein GCM10028862_01710 [Luteimonas pelagia]
MDAAAANAAVVALASVDGRAEAARRLAGQLGVDDMRLLVRHPHVDTLLPAPGLARTLPGGAAWRDFVARCGSPGIHRGKVPGPAGEGALPIAACSDGTTAMLFAGGAVADDTLGVLATTLPVLSELLAAQLGGAICQGELAAARSEMRQYATLARSLDEARAQLDATVHELGVQARRLREQQSKAERAMRAKDEFLAMLGHELRNPLAPIVTVLEVMRLRGAESPELAIMQRQVRHLQRLVDDLLDVSRIARGKLALDRKPIELGAVIDAAIETVQPLLAQKDQRIALDVAGTGLPVLADAARLAQVFSNLLTNASKFSAPGGEIQVRASRSGGKVVAEVVDKGIGIAPEMLPRVFDLFEQEATTLDRSQGGLGLGLSIVRNLVSQHGGHVSAHSNGLGRGSRFVVKLPVAASTPEARAGDAAPAATKTVRGLRVLLVDDNADAANTLSLALEVAGYTVAVAEDGRGALERAVEFQPEVAVLDIGLPGMNGYELARALRGALPGQDLVLIALTGYGQPEDRKLARDAGFHAHLLKPVDVAHLCALVDSLAAERSTAAAQQD